MNLVNDRLMQLNDEVRAWEFLSPGHISADLIEPKEFPTGQEPIESSNPLVRVVKYASNMKVNILMV